MPQAILPLMIVGTALAGVGAYTQYQAAKGAAGAQSDIARQQMAIEAERKKAMELDARRKQLEVLRNQQRAQSLALAGATNQGAQFGSGLSGAYGQVQGQSTTNAVGIGQNLEIGRNIFGYNANISQDQINLAGFGANSALGAGLSSFGGSLMNAGIHGKSLFGGFGGYGTSYYNPDGT